MARVTANADVRAYVHLMTVISREKERTFTGVRRSRRKGTVIRDNTSHHAHATPKKRSVVSEPAAKRNREGERATRFVR